MSQKILILLLFFTVTSTAQNNNGAPCPASSCGNIRTISFPFRLRGDPVSCGYNHPSFQLDCVNNQTVFTVRSRRYNVQEINYDEYSIRLVDPSINRNNLSSCPSRGNSYDDWPTIFTRFLELDVEVVFIHCSVPVNSVSYVESSFCGNRSYLPSNSSQIYSYVVVRERFLLADLEEFCTVDIAVQASVQRAMRNGSSLASIYDLLAYGFEISWFRVLCQDCERTLGFCSLEGNTISCTHYCREDTPISQLGFRCRFNYWILIVGSYFILSLAGLQALKFLIGFIFLIGLVVYKWRRRHLPIDETKEEIPDRHNTVNTDVEMIEGGSQSQKPFLGTTHEIAEDHHVNK